MAGRPCKGMCPRYKPTGHIAGHKRYANGQKRCSVCEAWIKWDGINCPCCGNMLRTRPENRRYREIFKDSTNEDTIVSQIPNIS